MNFLIPQFIDALNRVNSNQANTSNHSNHLNQANTSSLDNDLSYHSSINYIEITRKDIEKIIGMKPSNVELYKTAFVHKSVVKTAQMSDTCPDYMYNSYERFEFLGDSVLGLTIAKFLFSEYPNEQEGLLTKKKTKLVNGKILAEIAIKLELNKFLVLNTKVENINGRNNPRILEDVFEALICAIYLDLGFSYAEKFIIQTFKKYIDFEEIFIDDNFKDILLRYCQANFNTTPSYDIIEINGPPHKRYFKVICKINDLSYNIGSGKSKKIAEQKSAEETLKHFNYFKI